jgi:trehalose 6-phosphate synthase/phosphatase
MITDTHEAILIVSNRLPVTVTPSGIERSSGGLVAALEGMSAGDRKVTWLGWPGKDVPENERESFAQTLRRDYGCEPVFISDQLAKDHYEGFSNSSIWPIFHYLPSNFRYRDGWYDAYAQVNRLFAERVVAGLKDGDMVWVHDYQLMLLPHMIKTAKPGVKVGFFLHTPFPSYDVYRCLPHREELLRGVLGADVIGFHTFGYLRHFRSNVLRLLGHQPEIATVRHEGRTTSLGVYPIGINAGRFDEELQTEAFREQLKKTAAAFRGKRLILSVERLDYTKGILRRLEAIEIFLSRLDSEARERVKFIFVSVPTRGGVDEYRELRRQVEAKIGRINGQYATVHNSPLHFIHGSVDFAELCALYALADVALVTPLIDGMNLIAKEFIACQREELWGPAGGELGLMRRGPGVLVLSEFAGAAQELFNAIMVNPYDGPAIAGAIEEALAMPEEERRRRMQPMRERVFTYDAAAWAKDFVTDLSKASLPPARGAGNGLPKARARLEKAFAAGERVALFLDYDGTLRELVSDPAAAGPTPELRHLLDQLRPLRQVDVTIISGRTPGDLETFLGDYSEFGLVAEHGAAIRPPGQTQWRQLDENLDFRWMEHVARIVGLYQRSTPGTHIERKRTSLVWHYRRADPEFGAWKASQLVEELTIVTANDPIVIRHGRKIVEIASAQINKGAAVSNLLRGKEYDLVLVAGDDQTDESMFQLAPHSDTFTIRVGDGETRARYVIDTPAAMRELLEKSLDRSR